jgi:Domain of unknown function (DUF4965)/Domain of unknown function (DUF1793)/Domain of unknown function (DUF5127)/Domain of unknown function (DUF4964)
MLKKFNINHARLSALLVILVTSVYSLAQSSRVPAVPLITHDPYFSIWSMNDNLTDGPTRHWTGAPEPLTGLVRVDGKTFRWMGARPQSIPAITQTSVEITPTRTIYRFKGEGVRLEITFLSPLLLSDLDVLSRPVTYVTMTTSATDAAKHKVQFLFGVSSQLALNTYTEDVVWSRSRLQSMTVLRASSFKQPVLEKSGDDLRIDWGYLLLGVPDQEGSAASTQSSDVLWSAFSSGKPLPADDMDAPRRGDQAATLAAAFGLDDVGTNPVSRHVLLGYDDLYSIEYLNRWLRPYWRRNGMGAGELLETAEREYRDLDQRAHRFDEELMADLREVGGPAYTQLAILAYRQTVAAHNLAADVDGKPMLFPKENFSNGCISTVDVIYPSAPMFLLLNPELVRAQLRPLMEYTRTGRWHFPFAPHDLGTYPKANGQVYGGGERNEDGQMPVEESGNMLLLFAALAKAEGRADFANQYWSELRKWAGYLEHEGMDPANQLSTDDFAGHLAHNANLSIKAILALDAYAILASKTNHPSDATKYHALAEQMAKRWTELAGDGDHFRLAFDKAGTWSQKYNLVWDRILDLNIFSPAIAQTELRFYKAHMNEYGLPLDNRSAYTKLDWEVWTATLADNRADFDALIAPLTRFINESPSRVPLTDWYWTTDAKQVGFQARSVVGGVYIPLLATDRIWKKWSASLGF